MPSSTPAGPTIIPRYLTSLFSSVAELTSTILLHFAFISLTLSVTNSHISFYIISFILSPFVLHMFDHTIL
ncbi:hypothetical protein GGU11DRAFT_802766, partial [Lentinula aff. detonsa]